MPPREKKTDIRKIIRRWMPKEIVEEYLQYPYEDDKIFGEQRDKIMLSVPQCGEHLYIDARNGGLRVLGFVGAEKGKFSEDSHTVYVACDCGRVCLISEKEFRDNTDCGCLAMSIRLSLMVRSRIELIKEWARDIPFFLSELESLRLFIDKRRADVGSRQNKRGQDTYEGGRLSRPPFYSLSEDDDSFYHMAMPTSKEISIMDKLASLLLESPTWDAITDNRVHEEEKAIRVTEIETLKRFPGLSRERLFRILNNTHDGGKGKEI